MNIEQERTEFEAWLRKHYNFDALYEFEIEFAFAAFQAGRATMQSQSIPADDWFDMFVELARNVVVASRIFAVSPTTSKQEAAADAIDALQEHARKYPALQSQDREDAERYRWLRDCTDDQIYAMTKGGYLMGDKELDEAIDHARRVEGEEE